MAAIVLHLTLQQVGERSAEQGFHVLRCIHLGTGHGDAAGEVHLARAEQSAQHDGHFGSQCPHYLTLVHGIDAIDVYAHISRGVGAVEHAHFSLADGEDVGVDLRGTDTEVNLGHFSQCLNARLEVSFLAFHHETEVGGERHFAESGDEDGLGAVFGRSNHIVRTLAHEGEKSAFEQQFLDGFSVHFGGSALQVEALGHLFSVGLHAEAKQFSAFAALYANHGTTHGGHKLDALGGLVNKQGVAGQHSVALLHNGTRHDAWEVCRHQRVVLAQAGFRQFEFGLAFQPQI